MKRAPVSVFSPAASPALHRRHRLGASFEIRMRPETFRQPSTGLLTWLEARSLLCYTTPHSRGPASEPRPSDAHVKSLGCYPTLKVHRISTNKTLPKLSREAQCSTVVSPVRQPPVARASPRSVVRATIGKFPTVHEQSLMRRWPFFGSLRERAIADRCQPIDAVF